MYDEGYFSPFHRQNVVKASSMIPAKKVGDILREARGQSLRVGKDSCLTRRIRSAGIKMCLRSGCKFSRSEATAVGIGWIGWRTGRILGESEGGDETGE